MNTIYDRYLHEPLVRQSYYIIKIREFKWMIFYLSFRSFIHKPLVSLVMQ